MPMRKPSNQPKSSLSLVHGDITRNMVGAWFLSSPGVGGRVHNHAPLLSGNQTGGAGPHGVIANPYASNGWRNQHDAITLETSDNVAEASGTFVELGDPIGTNDDVSVLVGWIPAAQAVPTGTNPGTMFVRGQDGSGNGWSVFLRHDGTNQISHAVVIGGSQVSATGTNANIRPGIPNFAAGRTRQGINVAVACNGRMLTTTATALSGLRTSSKGCRIGAATSTAVTSHCDPVMFVVLWKRALSDAELQLVTEQPWILWAAPDTDLDLIAQLTLTRDTFTPVDSAGIITLGRDAVIPVDSMGWWTRDAVIPVDSKGWWLRDAVIPVDSLGVNPFSLAHAWNVRRFFEASLFHDWSVLNNLLTASLEHDWRVISQAFGQSLPHSWKVIPDVAGTFGIDSNGNPIPSTDIMCPVATVTIT
jgi:hypothetical protein